MKTILASLLALLLIGQAGAQHDRMPEPTPTPAPMTLQPSTTAVPPPPPAMPPGNPLDGSPEPFDATAYDPELPTPTPVGSLSGPPHAPDAVANATVATIAANVRDMPHRRGGLPVLKGLHPQPPVALTQELLARDWVRDGQPEGTGRMHPLGVVVG